MSLVTGGFVVAFMILLSRRGRTGIGRRRRIGICRRDQSRSDLHLKGLLLYDGFRIGLRIEQSIMRTFLIM